MIYLNNRNFYLPLTLITTSLLLIVSCQHSEKTIKSVHLSTPAKEISNLDTIQDSKIKAADSSQIKPLTKVEEKEEIVNTNIKTSEDVKETVTEESVKKPKKYYDFGIGPKKSLTSKDQVERQVNNNEIEKKNNTQVKVEKPTKKAPITQKKEKDINKKIVKQEKPVIEKEKVVKKEKVVVKSGPQISFEQEVFDFGEIYEGDKKDFKFVFKNIGQQELEIIKAVPSCGCTLPSYPFIPLSSGESGFIGVTYNSVGKSGFQDPQVEVYTNIQEEPFILKLKGTVLEKLKEEVEEDIEASIDSIKN